MRALASQRLVSAWLDRLLGRVVAAAAETRPLVAGAIAPDAADVRWRRADAAPAQPSAAPAGAGRPRCAVPRR